MMYLTTDSHLGHAKIIAYGRDPAYEQKILQGWKQLTGADVLIHLGDFCIGQDARMHELYLQPLPCKKWLIRGNHDKKSLSWYLAHGWDAVAESLCLDIFGKQILLSHRPTEVLPPGVWNIHGHWHGNDHRQEESYAFYTTHHRAFALEDTHFRIIPLRTIVASLIDKDSMG